ncbi:hypothetical protein MKW92_017674 [Papaver armeniacum]|nr:hypothetical protein MKW92_017674 [Papaver armeniacum]
MQGKFQKSSETFNVDTEKWDFVEEDKLESNMSYGSKWRKFIELPSDVSIGTHVVAWKKKMLSIGSDIKGGIQNCYALEFEIDEKRPKWTKLETLR